MADKNDTKIDALIGGREVAVTIPGAAPETVFVRQIKASELVALLNVIDHEVKMIELCTGKTVEWIDTLSLLNPADYAALATAVNEVNMDFFSSWYRRQKSRQTSLFKTG